MQKETGKKTNHSLRPLTPPLDRASLVELCKKDLDAAIPLFTAAQSAIDSLRKTDFPEVGRAFRKPPRVVAGVFECLIHLRTGLDESIELFPRTGRPKDISWRQSERMCFDASKFLHGLKSFKSEIDEGKVPQANVDAAKGVMKDMGDNFSADIARKSASPWATVTAALVDWIRNMVSYYDLIAVVEERKKLLARQQTSNVS